jgi:hypothetical protein
MLPEEGSTPQAEALVISERGWKVRIVTKSPGALVALGHQVRLWFQRGLRNDRSIRTVLAGDHRQAVEELFPSWSRGGLEVLSADLKTATDLIGRDTYEAIWTGISRSFVGQQLPGWVGQVVRLAIGPQRISYPTLDGTPVTTSQRGALMGLPTTWSFLCLANLFWWSKAHSRVDFRLLTTPKAREEAAKTIPRVRICGDDLVGATTAKSADEYERLARASGAKFSGPSKHIRSPFGGVFTEEVFFTSSDPDKDDRLVLRRWSQAFPVRGILGTLRSDATGREAPYWISMGPALEGMMEERNRSARRRILFALRMAHPELMPFLRGFGLQRLWHVPRQFGGLGIPTETMWSTSVNRSTSEVHQAAFVVATSSAWDDDLSILSRPYDTSLPTTLPIRRVAGNAASLAIAGRYQVVRSTSAAPVGWFEWPGTVDGLLERVTGNVARDIFFLSDFQPAAGRKGMKQRWSQLARTLAADLHSRRKDIITNKGGWIFRRGGSRGQTGCAAGNGAGQGDAAQGADKHPWEDLVIEATPTKRGEEVLATPPRWTPARTLDVRALTEPEQVNLVALSVGMGFTMTELARLPEWERQLLLDTVMEQWQSGSPLPPRPGGVRKTVEALRQGDLADRKKGPSAASQRSPPVDGLVPSPSGGTTSSSHSRSWSVLGRPSWSPTPPLSKPSSGLGTKRRIGSATGEQRRD